MDEEAFFDVAFEGTGLKDAIRLSDLNTYSVVVYDKNQSYGTTYKNLNDLVDSKYVYNPVIRKRSDISLAYEVFPCAIRPTNLVLETARKNGILDFVRFVPICEHLYVSSDRTAYKIPYSKTEIAEVSYLSSKERNSLFKCLSGKISFDKVILSENVKNILIRGICGVKGIDQKKIKMYLEAFNNVPFLYPKYGIIEICEMLARSFSMNCVAYIVNCDVEIVDEEYKGNRVEDLEAYKHKIITPQGVVWTKKHIPRVYGANIKYKRVVLTNKKLQSGMFYGIYDTGNYKEDEPDFLEVLCLNSESMVCPENYYVIYVTKCQSDVSDDDLSFIGLDPADVHLDVSFATSTDMDIK